MKRSPSANVVASSSGAARFSYGVVFVLVRSLSVGPSTWRPVAEHLTAVGNQVRVPSLLHVGSGDPLFCPAVVSAVRNDACQVPADSPVALVAHSNAALFLLAIRRRAAACSREPVCQ